ncbi:HAAS signaling domain-containing protein [Lacisediminihabitans sp. FW035]
MKETDTPQVVSGYLAELDRKLADVTEEVRQGIVAGIAEELEGLDAAAAAARIESLGDPAFIAAEARAGAEGPASSPAPGATRTTKRPTPPRASEQRWYVVVTTVLLEFGGLVVPLAGWVAGIMLLWASSLWTRGEKLVATILPPAVGVVLFGVFALVGSGGPWWHALVLGGIAGSAIASIVIGIVLSRRAWTRVR